MTKTQRLIQIAVVAAALLLPASAFASGPVHDALAGTVLDPMASTVKVVPPRGGAVMVYRDGKLKGWFLQAGLMTVEPGRVYGVVASRGNYMLFSSGVVMREGYTEMSWRNGGNTPLIAYTPSYRHYPHRVAAQRTRHGARHGAQHGDRRARGSSHASARANKRHDYSSRSTTRARKTKKVVNVTRKRRVLRGSATKRMRTSKRMVAKKRTRLARLR